MRVRTPIFISGVFYVLIYYVTDVIIVMAIIILCSIASFAAVEVVLSLLLKLFSDFIVLLLSVCINALHFVHAGACVDANV